MKLSILVGVAIAAFASSRTLPAQTTISVPCQQDNTLYESPTGSLSSGSGQGLYVGRTGQATNNQRRALLKFNVAAAVPAGAHIVSATLSITTVQSAFAGPLDVFGHRVTQAWGEGASVAPGGGGGGGAATAGDATWRHTFWPTSFWTNIGGDFVPTASLVITTQPFGTASSSPSAALTADVQSWLDSPATNHGWLLKTTGTLAYVARKIDSRETTTGTPPSLTVTYLLPGQSGTYGTGCPVGAGIYTYAMSGPVIGGTAVNLVQSNGPAGQFSANALSLGFDPLGVSLLPGCRLYLPIGPGIITHSIVPLDSTGAASTPLLLPIGFSGVPINAQAAALDTSPSGFVLSNAAVGVLQ